MPESPGNHMLKSQELAETEPQAEWETWKRWKKNASVTSVNKTTCYFISFFCSPESLFTFVFLKWLPRQVRQIGGCFLQKIVCKHWSHMALWQDVARFWHSPHSIKCSNKFHTWVQSSVCPVAFYTYGFHSWFLILYSGKNVVGAGLCLCIKLSCKHITFSKANNIYHLDAFMITVAQLKKSCQGWEMQESACSQLRYYTKALDTDLILPSVWIMALKGYAKDVLVRSENAAGVMKHLGILQLHPLSTVGLSQNVQGEKGASFIPPRSLRPWAWFAQVQIICLWSVLAAVQLATLPLASAKT